MWRLIVVIGGLACALTSNAASARQIDLLAPSNAAIDQSRASPQPGGLGSADSRSAAVVSGTDVIAGRTFVGRDPDRHIRFQILRDSKF